MNSLNDGLGHGFCQGKREFFSEMVRISIQNKSVSLEVTDSLVANMDVHIDQRNVCVFFSC
ncbi:MAG: hypothetical protein AAGJ95_01935, partial [Cyanobacteria bacterium J06554_11]